MSDPDPAPTEAPRRPWRDRLARVPWRLWLGPALALLVAIVAAVVLWGKMRRDTWAYYTDGAELRAEIADHKARPVLWEDPEPQSFDEGEDRTVAAPSGRLEAAFSADGTTMLLVRWEKAGTNADLYSSQWDGRRWSKPEPLNAINTPANERGPALSHDGSYLYFASDRKGGRGGYDLYAARWDGQDWKTVEALPATVNTPANELGPALSPDGAQLYFSSDRAGQSEDIFVSNLTIAEGAALPAFAAAEAVDTLNSKAADLQAAMTARGDHVFLASDRERSKKHGFKVYFSRVVDGAALPPEEVDLYLESGDATDPAVRMEGFDLLFSTNQAAPKERPDDASSYSLFRSTTREVITYTDLSRWEQFKELIHNIKWWILLAIAALIALIYILEKWRDMTSLFHKCLAGSGLVHLLLLLLAAAWLIAKEIKEDDKGASEDVEIDIDALAQEELAMESIPEETELTNTDTNLEQEKAEAEFGAPGFEAQDEAQPVPNAAPAAREAVVEAKPTVSNPAEQPVPEPPQESSVLSQLDPSTLPMVEPPTMEEREPSETQPVADTSSEIFEPEPPTHETDQTESEAVADTAVESEAEASEVTEVQPQDPAESVKVSVVEVPVAEPMQESPAEQSPLESEVLSELPPAHFDDPNEVVLDEPSPNASDTPADSSQDTFSPENAVANLPTEQSESGSVADSAVNDSADTGEVGASESVADAPAMEGVPSELGETAPNDSVPPSELDSGALSGLPDLALNDPGVPMLEENDQAPAGAPADPSADTFKPSDAASNLNISPTQSEAVADRAMETEADPTGVASAEVEAAPAVEARPEVGSSMPITDVPLANLEPGALTLPEPTLLDPGAGPLMEEPAQQPAGAPADPARDQFAPGGAVANLNTSQSESQAVADAAMSNQSAPSEVASGARDTTAVDVATQPAASSSNLSDVPPSDPVAMGSLPEASLLDPGAVTLEEPGQDPGAPADASKDQFKPGGGSALATTQATSTPGTEGAVGNQVAAESVTGTSPGRATDSQLPGRDLEANVTPELGGGSLAPQVGPLGGLATALLPAKLEAKEGMKPGDMAKVIQKQRGKPGLDTIKQMGGSDGTEKAISAAILWLVNNQEENGHWDTLKHGAKHEYDTGATGLALLCFYGWGERHDAGKHQESVRKALDWLLTQQDAKGFLGGRPAMMYSHAIATIALCEAYGVTKDERLRKPAERAIAYTLAAQSKTRGGWRYNPGEDSDTSITGWQYMALHSARMAGLQVPEESFERVRGFLDRTGGGKHGGLYGYQNRSQPSKAMVATGMFCRQLDLVPPSDPKMMESARWLKMQPMKSSKPDLYYVYYATLALYQHQGPIWTQWNERLKEILPLIQNKTGSNKGSWDASAGLTAEGGRVVSTALATLSLEVYYRLLPMYGFRNQEAEEPEVKKRGN